MLWTKFLAGWILHPHMERGPLVWFPLVPPGTNLRPYTKRAHACHVYAHYGDYSCHVFVRGLSVCLL